MLLTQKYAPKRIDDLAGNDEAKARIKQWILNWMRGIKQKMLLIAGPSGIGKTSVAYALKEEYDLELIEMNASDLRNGDHVEKMLTSASSSNSLSGKHKLILVDDVDALSGKDRGGASAVLAMIRHSEVPVILTATYVWDKKLSGIRSEAQIVDFKRISKSSVKKALVCISEAEGIKAPESLLDSISENCFGDLRSAINDLHAGSSTSRDREKDIYQRIRSLFKATTYKEARETGFGDVEHDFLKLWVDENIALEYENTKDVALAYHYLSRSDLFDGRIMKRQYWGFLRYSGDLLTAGVALSKSSKSMSFVKYQFPNYLKQMSVSSAKRAMLKGIGLKIGAKVHSRYKDGLLYLDIIRNSLSSIPDTQNFYRFEDEEAAFILGVSVSELKKTEDKPKIDEKKPPKSAKAEKKAEEKKPNQMQKTEDKPKTNNSTLSDFL